MYFTPQINLPNFLGKVNSFSTDFLKRGKEVWFFLLGKKELA